MQARKLPSRAGLALACILAAVAVSAAPAAPQQKEEKEKEKKEETKGEGGLFSGFKKATGRGEQRQATVSAGAKGVGEGKEMGIINKR